MIDTASIPSAARVTPIADRLRENIDVDHYQRE